MHYQSGTWTANVTGATGSVTYQWQQRTAAGTTWTNVGNGTSTYTRTAALNSFYLRVTATSGGVSTISPEFHVQVIADNTGGGDCGYNTRGQWVCQ
jgi:hypothetical protein